MPNRFKPDQLGTVAVALAFVGLALPNGAYSTELQSGVTCVIWAALITGILVGVLPRAPVPKQALIAGCVLAALALLTGASMAWGTDDGAAFTELVRVAGYLGLFALVVCLSTPGSARTWLVGVAIGIAIVGVLALGSRLVPALPGDDKQIAEFLPAARGRLSYPIGNWNVLAAIMALGVVLFTWLGAEASTRRARSMSVGAIPVLALVAYLTSSRGGAIAALVGLALLIGLAATRLQMLAGLALAGAGGAVLIVLTKGRADLLDGLDTGTAHSQGIQVLLATIVVVALVGLARSRLDESISGWKIAPGTARIALVAAAVVALAGVAIADPVKRLDDFKAPPTEGGELEPGFVASHFTSGSSSGRYQFWSEAVDAFKDEPLHGIGAGGYEAYWAQHAPITRAIRDAHSLYLETLAELGPLGLALILGFFATGVVAGISRWRPSSRSELAASLALLGAGATSAGIEVIWETPAAFAPVVLAVGLLTGPAIAHAADPVATRAPGGQARFGWAVALLTVGWIALLAAGDAFLSQRALEESRSAARSADFGEAATRAEDAIALQPWAAEPRLQLALVHEAAGDLAQARGEAAEATGKAPDDWQVWLARARIEARSGRAAAASAALQQARRLNPRAPIFAQPSQPPPSP